MTNKFSIEFQPLSRDFGNIIERATFAELRISAGLWIATELEDLHAKTVRPTARVSAYSFAKWLASNWWRLRWEPERERKDLSWKLSHKVGASGDGYLWPDLTFSSDGDTVLIHSQSISSLSKQPIRYLNDFDVIISAAEFEQEIDTFIDAVIGRLISEGVGKDDLLDLWSEVLEERRDPEKTRWRKFEAIMGFDPCEGPNSIIQSLEKAASKYGTSAVEEMAAGSREKAVIDIETLWGEPYRAAPNLTVPNVETIKQRIHTEVESSLFPWQKAEEAAKIVRDVFSLNSGPVTTQTLSDVFNISKREIEEWSNAEGPINAAFRNGKNDTIKVFLRSHYSANRRFALLRLIGDYIEASQEDRLIPSTNVSTQRQKFQRAFAQEFLCPYTDLSNFIGSIDELSDDAIEEAAHYFDVSPLLVKTTLANKGHLERSRLVS